MFFDAIILEDRIPVFDYGDTFDMGLNFDDRVLAAVNASGPILFDVAVGFGPYHEVKAAALEELRKLYERGSGIRKRTAEDVLSELDASDYRWQPSLGSLDDELNSDEKKLAKYFLGGLIFGA